MYFLLKQLTGSARANLSGYWHMSEILFPVQKLKSAGTEVSPGADLKHFPHAGAGYTYQKRASMSKPTQHSPPPWQPPLPQSVDPTVPGGGGECRGGAGGGGEAAGWQGGRALPEEIFKK